MELNAENVPGIDSVSDWLMANDMHFVLNVADVMHGSSTVDRFAVNDDAMAIMQSMLSTIRLQFGSQFYVLSPRSFWNMGIYRMIEHLGCTPLNALNDPGWTAKYGHKESRDRRTIYVRRDTQNSSRTAEWDEKLFKDFVRVIGDGDGDGREFTNITINGIVHKLLA